MSRVFISYKRADKNKVFPLKERIEAAIGERCWIDLDGIESDAQFANIIMQAIDNASIFLFMYSKEHTKITDYERDWTIREINYAQTQGKRIVFLNIDKTPLSKWFNFMFGLKQQVDATSEEAVEAMIKDLKKWLSIQNGNQHPTAHREIATQPVQPEEGKDPSAKQHKIFWIVVGSILLISMTMILISSEESTLFTTGSMIFTMTLAYTIYWMIKETWNKWKNRRK